MRLGRLVFILLFFARISPRANSDNANNVFNVNEDGNVNNNNANNANVVRPAASN